MAEMRFPEKLGWFPTNLADSYELGFNQLMILMLKKSQIIRLAPGHDINSMKIHETLTRSPKYNIILFSRGADSKAICWDISDLQNLPLSTPQTRPFWPDINSQVTTVDPNCWCGIPLALFHRFGWKSQLSFLVVGLQLPDGLNPSQRFHVDGWVNVF